MADQIDPNAIQTDPQGQLDVLPEGNAGGEGDAGAPPTEFIDIKGVKIPASEFESLAKEKYKDRFDAFENREKWQAENTKKAQENAALKRDAEAFQRLKQDPRFMAHLQGRPNDPKQAYVQKKVQAFPDVDPRFFESQYDDMMEMAGARAQESVTPLLQQQSEEWEKGYLQSHPLIEKGSEKYFQIAELVGKGYNPEHAYQVVYSQELRAKEIDDQIKKRDEEAKRKITQSRQTNSSQSSKPASTDEAFEKAWAKYGS